MSVVLVGANGLARLGLGVETLRAQTRAGDLEVILVCPRAEGPPVPGGLGSLRVVEVGPIADVDRAAAAGIRQASAPLVAILEDHAFPRPTWAAELIVAAEGPWTAIGSGFDNANPRFSLSWANLLMAYGNWVGDPEAGETESISRHNLVLRRDALARHDGDLERLLGRDGGLLDLLRAEGARFALAPKARVRHLNPSRLDSTVRLRVDAGRLAAASRVRSEGWSVRRRALYAAASPLIPLARGLPLRRAVSDSGLGPRALGALGLALTLDAAGQAAGFVRGAGGSARRLVDFELDREIHLRRVDRAELPRLAEG